MGGAVAIVSEWIGGSAVTAAGVATVAGAVAETGAALAVAGAVTGSKGLQKIGGDMAIAGGVTDLGAAAVNAFDAGAAATGTADATQGAAADSSGATGSVASTASSGTPMPVNDSFTGAPPASQGIIGQTMTDPSALTADPASTLSGTPPQVPGVTPTVPGAAAPAAGATGVPFNNQALPTGSAMIPSTWGAQDVANYNNALQEGLKSGDISTWFQALDPATKAIVASGLVQTGGAALGGLSNAYTSQQQLQLAQLKNNQDFQKYVNAMSNLNAAPTTSFTGVPIGGQPSPNLLTGKPAGIIGSNLIGG
jgi:hypothetical protein